MFVWIILINFFEFLGVDIIRWLVIFELFSFLNFKFKYN